MPQVIIDLDDDVNTIVNNYSKEFNVSKPRAIKAIIIKYEVLNRDKTLNNNLNNGSP